MVAACGQSRLRIVDGFVETMNAQRADLGQCLHVSSHCLRLEGQRQQRSIWRDHQVIRQVAFEAEARHAKRTVLIILRSVKGIIA